jgi:nucleoside-diphosphate-sugar epimerase
MENAQEIIEPKKVLVVGGGLFTGRVFVILAERTGRYELTVLNLGHHPLRKDTVTERIADRRDPDALAEALTGRHFDAVVDFCAYEPGDARTLLEILGAGAGRYILLSSASILAPADTPRKESAPYRTIADPDNEVGHYLSAKIQLEIETKQVCAEKGIPYTIFRPSFIYGPFNYAPREPWYFGLMRKGLPVPCPADSTSLFSFVYVKDVAKALMAAVSEMSSADHTYLLAAADQISYARYEAALDALDYPYEKQIVSVEEVYRNNIPVPFPLEENDLYDGADAARELGFDYTDFETGFRETFAVFKSVM